MEDVIIYTSSTCPHCISTKQYLEDQGVNYLEKNVSTNRNAKKELMELGYMGVPVIIVDGEEIVGFDKDKLDQVLELS